MSLFRVYLTLSIDGYIADRNGEVAWLDPFFSREMDFEAFQSSIGATVMGRKTFDRALAEVLRQDLEGTDQDVWLMGGGESIRPFHEAGLVDRWELFWIPPMIGEGIPLFPRGSAATPRLSPRRTHTYSNGVVEVVYEKGR